MGADSVTNVYRSLRWHYPNQVKRSKATPSSQPVTQAPKDIIAHCPGNCKAWEKFYQLYLRIN